jgi:hypothetical protein
MSVSKVCFDFGVGCIHIQCIVKARNGLRMNATFTLRRYGLAALFCALATALALRLNAPSSCFSLAILVSCLYGGRGPGFLSIGLSGLAFDYLFLSPRFHLDVERASYLQLFAFLVTGLVIAVVIDAKRRVEKRREEIAAELRKSQSFLEEAQRISQVGSFGWSPLANKLYCSAETLRIAGVERSGTASSSFACSRVSQFPSRVPFWGMLGTSVTACLPSVTRSWNFRTGSQRSRLLERLLPILS